VLPTCWSSRHICWPSFKSLLSNPAGAIGPCRVFAPTLVEAQDTPLHFPQAENFACILVFPLPHEDRLSSWGPLLRLAFVGPISIRLHGGPFNDILNLLVIPRERRDRGNPLPLRELRLRAVSDRPYTHHR